MWDIMWDIMEAAVAKEGQLPGSARGAASARQQAAADMAEAARVENRGNNSPDS